MRFLKQSTGVTITMGPALDKTDGVTAETALSPTVYVSKNGGAQAARNSASAISHDRDGFYLVPLSTTDTGTLGRLLVQFTDAATHLPVWEWFMVLPANVFDSLVGGTANLSVDAVSISGDATAADNAESFFDGTGYAGTNNVIPTVTAVTNGVGLADGAITAAKIAGDAITAAKIAADVTTEIQSGLATAASIAALNNLSAAQVNAEVDTAIADAALATAANLATLTGYVDTEVASILSAVDTEVAAIKAVTDNLPNSGALTTIANNVAAILADTGTDGVVVASGSKTGYSLSADQSGVTVGTVNALGTQAKADVNAEVLDVLNVDTFAEPTSAPAATSSLRAKIGWLFKLARNKFTQTSTTATLYADDGTTADNTSTTSDNGSVFSRGEWS